MRPTNCISLLTIALMAIFLSFVSDAGAQDLGSANKLFGKKPEPAAPSSTRSKPAPEKKKPTANAAPRNTAKPAASATNRKPAANTPRTNSSGTAASRSDRGTRPVTPEPKKANAEAKPKVDIRPVEPVSVRIGPGGKPVTTVSVADYEKLLDEGNSARDRRDYAAAESSYRSARSAKPSDARAAVGLGATFVDQLRWEDAETAYRAALAADPGDAMILIALSYVLTQPVAAPDLAERYAEAEKLARRAIVISPNNALAHDQLGVSLEMRGLIGKEAEDSYRKAIELATNFAPAYAHLGRLLRRRGQVAEANAAYAEAISRARDVGTIILVAEVLQSEQRFAESERLLRSALNRDPKNPTAQLLLGRSLLTGGNFQEAEMMLRKSIENSRYPFQANLTLAALYSRQDRFDLAEGALMQAARYVTPFEKMPLARDIESVADGYLKTNRQSDAERLYKQALSLDPKNDSIASKLAKFRRS